MVQRVPSFHMKSSFGFFVDRIVSFKLVLPPKVPGGEPGEVCVTQPEAGKTDAGNDELYWAVRGGRPGAFGVLYEITLKTLWDADHPHSRTKFIQILGLELLLKLTLEYCAKKMLNDYNRLQPLVLHSCWQQPFPLRQHLH